MTKKLAKSFILTAIAAVFLMANCISSITAYADTIYTIHVEVKYGQTEARSMLDMINKFRTGNDAWYWNPDDKTKTVLTDLPKLEYDYGLEQIAMQRAAEIAIFFDHSRPDGSYCFDVTAGSAQSYGENIAVGYETAKDAFVAWQETDSTYLYQGHRRNMLEGYSHVGIAHVYANGSHYWVQEFGYAPSNVSKTAANDSQKIVNVDVSSDNIFYNYVESAPSSLTLSLGKTTNVPTVTMMFSTIAQWGGYYRHTVTPNWSVSGDAVTISGGKITAKSVGTATLTATVYGNKVTVPITVECTSHKWGSWSTTKEATCTDKGSQTRKCSICGKSETQSMAAKGHSFGSYSVTKEATCTDKGTQTRKCSVCGEKESKSIAAKGHSFGEYRVVTQASADKEGLEERTCSVCAATEQRTIAKLAAEVTTAAGDATVTETSDDQAETTAPVDSEEPAQTTTAAEQEEPKDEASSGSAEPTVDSSSEEIYDADDADDISASDSNNEPNSSQTNSAAVDDEGISPIVYCGIAAGAIVIIGAVIIFIRRRR